jgi:hypothetical protein
MPSSSTILIAFSILIPLLLIYAIIRAFRDARKEKTILSHIQILRRSIAASCILGFLLMLILPAQTKNGEWNYGGFVLFFISAINYGYAQRAEKAAIAAEALKK